MSNKTRLWQRVQQYLEENPVQHTYGAVGAVLGTTGRAVGQCMKAIGNRGRSDLCALVVHGKR